MVSLAADPSAAVSLAAKRADLAVDAAAVQALPEEAAVADSAAGPVAVDLVAADAAVLAVRAAWIRNGSPHFEKGCASRRPRVAPSGIDGVEDNSRSSEGWHFCRSAIRLSMHGRTR